MKSSAWSRALAATVSTVVAGGLLAISPAAAADDVTINLVAVNDFHGQIDDNVVQWAATVEQLLADGSDGNSLLISAGDNVGESAEASSAQNDDPAIDVLNLLGVDASAVGNHEFDKGYDDLVNHIMARADFPILGANVKKLDGSPALDASTMFTVSGVRVAVIGAVTEETPDLVEPSGIAQLSFGAPVEAINAEVDRLNALPEAERPDVIVATLHEGAPWGSWSLEQAMQSSSAFNSIVQDTSPDVDAIITGHTHNTYVYNAPISGDESRTRPVIQTGFHGQNVGQIKLTVAPDTGEVKAYTARNVPRITTSDDNLIGTSSTLAEVADIRDAAVAFAAARAEEAAQTKVEYDAAVASKDEAAAKATQAKADYDAAVAEGKEAYATASSIKEDYLAAVAEGKDAYATAVSVKDDYLAAVAEGKDAYATAASVKQEYDAAVAEGKGAYATAASVKQEYDAAVAEGKDAYATAASVKQEYDAAVAEGRQAYATAAALKEQYLTAKASGDPDASIVLADLAQQYLDAVAAGDAAYARAAGMKTDYDAAIAAGQDAYARAAAMKTDYDAAIAAGQDAYARAAGMKSDYDAAIAAGNAAYTKAAAMVPDYLAAKQAGDDAYAKAAAMVPDYLAAKDAGDQAYAEASLLKQLLDAAVATLNAALATVAELRDKLLSLGGIL